MVTSFHQPSRQPPLRASAAEVVAAEVKFVCPACLDSLRADIRKAGQTVNCPKCAVSMRVPAPSAAMLSALTAVRVGGPAKSFERNPTLLPQIGSAVLPLPGKSPKEEEPPEVAPQEPGPEKTRTAAPQREFAATRQPAAKSEPSPARRSVFDILERKLGTAEDRSVVIESLAENEEAGEFALQLAAVFCASGWSITRRECVPGKAPDDGLALSAGACPFPDEVTQIYAALSVTELNFSCHIDPDQIREAAIVRVGANPLG